MVPGGSPIYLNPNPSPSGCTIRSDYTFDPSLCLTAPISENVNRDWIENFFASTKSGSRCLDSRSMTGGHVTSLQGSSEQYCEVDALQTTLTNFWQRWHITSLNITYDGGHTEESYFETITIPSSLRSCLPGPASCLYKYEGASCPRGHTALSIASFNGIQKLYCCPQAEILLSTLTDMGTTSTVDFKGSEAMSWFDGPLVGCVYHFVTSGRWLGGQFPTTLGEKSLRFPTVVENYMMMKPITIDLLATSLSSISTTIPTATPGSTATTNTVTPTSKVSPDTDTQLSARSKIGIGVGVSLGATLILAILVALLVLRRRRKKKNSQLESYVGKPELDGNPIRKETHALEAQDAEVHELNGIAEPVEIRWGDIQEIEDTGASVEAHASSISFNTKEKPGVTEVGRTSMNSG